MDRVALVRAVSDVAAGVASGAPVADALAPLDRHVGGDVLSLSVLDVAGRRPAELALRGAAPLDAEEQREWRRLIGTHPYAGWLATAPAGSSRLTDVVSLRQLERTEVYELLLAPRGSRFQAALVLDRGPESMTLLSLWREQRDFTDGEMEALEAARGLLSAALTYQAALVAVAHWAGVSTATGALSPRQSQVAGLVEQGLTNAQIATRLGITPRTVRKHVSDSFEATGCSSRTALALWWHRNSTGLP